MKFIEQFFSINGKDLEQVKSQLLGIYGLEYSSNLQNSKTQQEKTLANILVRRNSALVERTFLVLRAQYFSSKATPTADGRLLLSPEDAVEYAKNNMEAAELDVNIVKDNIGLLKIASNVPTGTIWGKERNIATYQTVLERMKDPENSYLTQAVSELEMAQAKYTSAYEAKKESVNGPIR